MQLHDHLWQLIRTTFLGRIACTRSMRCGLLLHICVQRGLSVCLSACLYVWHMVELCNMAEPIRSRCRLGLTHEGSRNHVRDRGVKVGQIHLQLRGVTSQWCSLLPNYLGHLFHVIKQVFAAADRPARRGASRHRVV